MGGWDLDPGSGTDPETWAPLDSTVSGSSGLSSLLTAYLWGCLVVFMVVVLIGETGGRQHRERKDANDGPRGYFVMAVLWPLFAAAVLFLVLWTLLTRTRRRR